MLSKIKLYTLKQKLWAIVATSFIARLIVFFALPNMPSFLAPDEGSYAEITRRLSLGQNLDQFTDLAKTSKTIVFPALLFLRLGSDPLSAVRLASLTYGLATLVVVAVLILKTMDKLNKINFRIKVSTSLILYSFLAYAFLPSHLLWSVLGLRESSMEFYIILVYGCIFFTLHIGKSSNITSFLLLGLSIFLVFYTRLQVGLILITSLLTFFLLVIKNRTAQKLLLVVIISGGISFTSLLIRPDEVIAGQILSIEARQEGNQLNAASKIQTLACPFENDSQTSNVACHLWRAPYMTVSFLIRPIIGLDVTSNASFYAASENLLWTGAIAFVLYAFIRNRRIPGLKPLAPALIFFVYYTVSVGSYEGNMGTAFRHRSLILWIILLLLIASFWGNTEYVRGEKRNNSQESAV
jgi:hypothetical protein